MEIHDVLAGLVVLIGLVGVVLVFLPGIALQIVAILVWAFEESNPAAWIALGLVVAVAMATTVLKYLHPGRQLRAAGIPSWLLLAAVVVAVVGLFVIPIVGAPIGFVLTIYLFERRRRGASVAWPSTKAALKALATSIGIELAGAFVITAVFFSAVVLV